MLAADTNPASRSHPANEDGHRRPPHLRIQCLELIRQRRQGRIRYPADHAQWMVLRDAAVQSHIAEQSVVPTILAAHPGRLAPRPTLIDDCADTFRSLT